MHWPYRQQWLPSESWGWSNIKTTSELIRIITTNISQLELENLVMRMQALKEKNYDMIVSSYSTFLDINLDNIAAKSLYLQWLDIWYYLLWNHNKVILKWNKILDIEWAMTEEWEA